MRNATMGTWMVMSSLVIAIGSSGSSSHDARAAPTPPAKTTAKLSPSCETPEHRQLDFWVGDWDLRVRARQTADGPWQESAGKQHIESILGGCAISESFTADGPGQAWGGRSYSVWQPATKKWRQTWVDDSGSYLAFIGAVENGSMTLYGEPRPSPDPREKGKTMQMRMVFSKVTPTSLHWEWQRSADEWKTQVVMLEIEYTRHK